MAWVIVIWQGFCEVTIIKASNILNYFNFEIREVTKLLLFLLHVLYLSWVHPKETFLLAK